jgi:hypothetical protein
VKRREAPGARVPRAHRRERGRAGGARTCAPNRFDVSRGFAAAFSKAKWPRQSRG